MSKDAKICINSEDEIIFQVYEGFRETCKQKILGRSKTRN
jgi:hypothetical protein